MNKKIFSRFYSKNNIFKVVSNPKEGTIKIYNRKGKIILKKTNLSLDQINTIEESLLSYITKKLISNNINKIKSNSNDPMIT